MIYICKDVENENDKWKCKSENQKYNQCCQNCNELKTCKYYCSYAHNFSCIAKIEK